MVELTRIQRLRRHWSLLRRARTAALLAAGGILLTMGGQVWYLRGQLARYQREQVRELQGSDELFRRLQGAALAQRAPGEADLEHPDACVTALAQSLAALGGAAGARIISLKPEAGPEGKVPGGNALEEAGLEPTGKDGDEAESAPLQDDEGDSPQAVASVRVEIEASYGGCLSFLAGLDHLPAVVEVGELSLSSADRSAGAGRVQGRFLLIIYGCH